MDLKYEVSFVTSSCSHLPTAVLQHCYVVPLSSAVSEAWKDFVKMSSELEPPAPSKDSLLQYQPVSHIVLFSSLCSHSTACPE